MGMAQKEQLAAPDPKNAALVHPDVHSHSLGHAAAERAPFSLISTSKQIHSFQKASGYH